MQPPVVLLSRRRSHIRCIRLEDPAPHDEASKSLIKWISDNKGYIHPELRLHGRQITSMSAIPSRTPLARIPSHLLIRTEESIDPCLETIFSQLPIGSSSGESGAWAYRLAIILLWMERQGRNLPHIKLLPGRASGTQAPLIGFSLDKDILTAEGQYLPLIEAVLNQKFFVSDFHDSVLSQLPPDHPLYPITIDDFTWALAVVSSRSFGVSLSPGSTHAMPPFIDMIDHSEAPNVEVQIEPEAATYNKRQLKLVSKAALAPGESLRLSYGYLDNLNLILSFGFVMTDNPQDKFEFDFSLVLDSISFLDPELVLPVNPWKVELLSRLGLMSSNANDAKPKRVFFRAPNARNTCPVEPRLLAAMEILQSPDELQDSLEEEVNSFGNSLGTLGSWPPKDPKTLELLSSLALALYKGMGSSIQEDLVKRKQLDPHTSPDKALVLDFRITMKRTLEKALVAIRCIK